MSRKGGMSIPAKRFNGFNPPLDSKEGMEEVARWARAGGWVLSEFHERLAKKHGVSFEGVTVVRQIPL